MADFIGNNIAFKGRGLVGKSQVLPNDYGVMGNGAGLFEEEEETPLIIEWTVAGDVTARTVTCPFPSGVNYNCVIDWDDGTTPSLVTSYNDANRIHTYASDGTYRSKIYDTAEGWSFNAGGDCLKVTDVDFGEAPDFDGFRDLDYGFYGCANLTSLGTHAIPVSTSLSNTNIRYLFRNCSSITSTIPDGFVDELTNATNISGLFWGCSGLTGSIPSGFLDNLTSVVSLSNLLQDCTGLTGSIPSGLLDYTTAVTLLSSMLRGCSGLTGSIPSGLLDNVTSATRIDYMFQNCSGLTGSIPSGILDYLTSLTHSTYCFQNCSGLTGSLPSGLLDNTTSLTTTQGMFMNCTGITGTIPAGFLDYITSVTNASYMFYGMTGITGYGADLCRTLTSCTDFSRFMRECTAMQLRADTFYQAGEEATRFLNQSVDFTECFDRNSFTGVQGTAPDLWNCTYGTGTPTTTDCWDGAGNSATSLTNYASIPGAWL